MIGFLRALFRRPKKLSWKRRALIAEIELSLVQQEILIFGNLVDPKQTIATIDRARA